MFNPNGGGGDAFGGGGNNGGFADFGFDAPPATNGSPTNGHVPASGSGDSKSGTAPGKVKITTVKLKKDSAGGNKGFGGGNDLMGGDVGGLPNPFALPAPGTAPIVLAPPPKSSGGGGNDPFGLNADDDDDDEAFYRATNVSHATTNGSQGGLTGVDDLLGGGAPKPAA